MTVKIEFASIPLPTRLYWGQFAQAEQVLPGIWLIEGDQGWMAYISLDRAMTLPEGVPRRQWYYGDEVDALEAAWNIELKFSDPEP